MTKPDFFSNIFHASLNLSSAVPEAAPMWLTPIILIGLGLLIGTVVEKLLIGTLKKLLNRTALALNKEITTLLRGVILWLFGLWGFYLATYSLVGVDKDVIQFLRKLIVALLLVAVIRLTARLSVAVVRFYLNHSQGLQGLPNTSIFENIIRVIVFIVGFIMLLQTIGISVVPLITALGVGGLAISLALQDTLANMFAGINMLLNKQIKVGDFVKLENGMEGVIMDIGWRNTLVRKLSNSAIIIPNSKMATSIIINHTLPFPETSIVITLNVKFDVDLEEVEVLAKSVAKEILAHTEGGIAGFEPAVRFHSFGETSIQFDVILRVQEFADQYRVRHEFMKALHTRFRREGLPHELAAAVPAPPTPASGA